MNATLGTNEITAASHECAARPGTSSLTTTTATTGHQNFTYPACAWMVLPRAAHHRPCPGPWPASHPCCVGVHRRCSTRGGKVGLAMKEKSYNIISRILETSAS